MELATAALDLAGVYSSLFTHTTTQSDNTIPLCHENTHSKILLHEYRERHCVLLQLSIYRKIFSLSVTSNVKNSDYHSREGLEGQTATETVTHPVESWRLDVCKGLATEANLVIEIMVGYLMSGDQFVSFATSKALTSFIVYIIADFESTKVFLKWINYLITLETFRTHVAVYTLQTFTDVLKEVRKMSDKIQVSAVSLWECVFGLLKQSMQLLKELYKQLTEKGEEEKKCRMNWVELSTDALLCLSIETLHHKTTSTDHMITSIHHMITNTDHMITSACCQEFICRHLIEFTSFLDFSQPIYVLKELLRLHQKSFTILLPQEYDTWLIHNSLVKLFQSNIFTRTAQSWLSTITSSTTNPTELSKGEQIFDTSYSTLLHTSTTDTNKQGFTLESSLISTVMRKVVLLLLKYSALVLAGDNKASHPTRTIGCVQLEVLLSSVAQQLNLPTTVSLSPPLMATAQHQLLELLSEQDACLIESLMLSCDITKILVENSSSVSPLDHPTLRVCLGLVHIHSLFVKFLSSFIFFDHSILIDYFISPETSPIFRQFLSQYLRLAANDWMSFVQACEQLGRRSNEMIPTDADISKLAGNEQCQSFEDHSPTLSQEEATVRDPKLALDSVLRQPREELGSRNKERIMTDSDTSNLTIISKRKDRSSYSEDFSISLSPGWTPVKRRKLDPDSSLSAEDYTTILSDMHSHTKTSAEEKGQPQALDVNADVSKESCDSDIEEELESSGSVYRETSLDKMMDCLTQFKYALLRLHSSQLLVPVNDSDTTSPMDSTIEGIISSHEQLEDLYEAMEKYL